MEYKLNAKSEENNCFINSMDYMSSTMPLRAPSSFAFLRNGRSQLFHFVSSLMDKYEDENPWKFETDDIWKIHPSTEMADEYVFGRVIGKGGMNAPLHHYKFIFVVHRRRHCVRGSKQRICD